MVNNYNQNKKVNFKVIVLQGVRCTTWEPHFERQRSFPTFGITGTRSLGGGFKFPRPAELVQLLHYWSLFLHSSKFLFSFHC
jgi:hypothetical protein